MVTTELTSYPKLIVAASHTALSGDLGVLIIEFPAVYRTTTTSPLPPPAITTTTTTAAEDVDIDLEEETDDYSIENGQIPLQDPYVLRSVEFLIFTAY